MTYDVVGVFFSQDKPRGLLAPWLVFAFFCDGISSCLFHPARLAAVVGFLIRPGAVGCCPGAGVDEAAADWSGESVSREALRRFLASLSFQSEEAT